VDEKGAGDDLSFHRSGGLLVALLRGSRLFLFGAALVLIAFTVVPRPKRRSLALARLGLLVLPGAALVAGLAALVHAGLSGPDRWERQGAAHATLKFIAAAQDSYRENDLDGDGTNDYGTLKELIDAGLLSEALRSGTRYGYVFQCVPSTTTPEFCWMATASPLESGPWHLATSQNDTIYIRWTQPFSLRDDCDLGVEGEASLGE
jgi:hypothetical protein